MATIKIKKLPKFQGVVGTSQVSGNYPIVPFPKFQLEDPGTIPPFELETFDKKADDERQGNFGKNFLDRTRLNSDQLDNENQQKYNASRKFQKKYDYGVNKAVKKYETDDNKALYSSFMTNKYITPAIEKYNKFNKITNTFNNALSAGAALGSQLEVNRYDKEYNNTMHKMGIPDYSASLSNPADKFGDYTQFGQFNPRYTGFKSKGTMTNAQYPGIRMAQDGANLSSGKFDVQEAFIPNTPQFQTPIGNGDASKGSDIPAPSETNSELAMPVKNFKLTSSYGHRGSFKGSHGQASTSHNGVDLAVPINSEIYSPMDGVVEKIYSNSKGGNQLVIRHTDGSISGYAHLNKYEEIQIGDPVKKGQVVALSGNTGNTTGPHLHFTWTAPDGTKVDPNAIFNFNGSTNRNPSGFNNASDEISSTHNNPLNIHYGNFAQKYGGKKGKADGNGYVAQFPDLNTGLEAAKDLLFNPSSGYYNLPLSAATERWVGHSADERVRDIINHIGSDKKISDLTPEEKNQFIKLSAKWEGKQGYNLIKDKQLYQEGGENNNVMKIRIVGTPENKMAFGGQSNYGLDMAYQNLYDTMSENPYEQTGKAVSEEEETEDNPYVLEAEGGETIKKPTGELLNITGPRHSAPQGGPKLTDKQAPKGSFIYSDTSKMKLGGKELAAFGKNPNSKKKYTPAELSKQYDTVKYLSILKDPLADSTKKRTAELMLQAYDKKLAQLAYTQESKKGFPSGIPEVAQPYFGNDVAQAAYGGMMIGDHTLPKAQVGLDKEFDYNGKKVNAHRVKVIAPGYAKTTIPNLYLKSGTPGTASSFQKTPKTGKQGDWHPMVKSFAEKGIAYEDLVKKYPTGKFVNDTPEVKAWWEQHYKAIPGTQSTPDDYVYTEDDVLPPGTTKTTPPGTTTTGDSTEPKTPPTLTIPHYNAVGQTIPSRWSKVDTRNVGNAYFNAATIKKYHPYLGQYDPTLPIPIAEDPTRALESIYSNQYLTPSSNIAGHTSSQGLASKLAYLSGKAMEAGADQIAQVGNRNAQRFTTADSERADILNKAALLNMQNRMSNVDSENIYDSKYWSAIRKGANAITKTKDTADTNMANTYNMNVSESPYYYSDPWNYMMRFNNQEAKNQFYNTLVNSKNNNGSFNLDDYAKQHKKIYSSMSHISDVKERRASTDVAMKIMMGNKTISQQYPQNPSQNYTRTTGYSGNNNNDNFTEWD